MTQDLSRLTEYGICCPVCQGDLRLLGRGEGLECAGCALRYRIEDDIPVLLAEEAIRIAPGSPAA